MICCAGEIKKLNRNCFFFAIFTAELISRLDSAHCCAAINFWISTNVRDIQQNSWDIWAHGALSLFFLCCLPERLGSERLWRQHHKKKYVNQITHTELFSLWQNSNKLKYKTCDFLWLHDRKAGELHLLLLYGICGRSPVFDIIWHVR